MKWMFAGFLWSHIATQGRFQKRSTPMKFKSEKVYTVNEAARLLNVAPHTILKHLHDGLIVGEQQHGKWFISESALTEYAGTPNPEFVNRWLPIISDINRGK
jgi:excisionase family DNA binding protein